jgi:hypothetical protein
MYRTFFVGVYLLQSFFETIYASISQTCVCLPFLCSVAHFSPIHEAHSTKPPQSPSLNTPSSVTLSSPMFALTGKSLVSPAPFCCDLPSPHHVHVSQRLDGSDAAKEPLALSLMVHSYLHLLFSGSTYFQAPNSSDKSSWSIFQSRPKTPVNIRSINTRGNNPTPLSKGGGTHIIPDPPHEDFYFEWKRVIPISFQQECFSRKRRREEIKL